MKNYKILRNTNNVKCSSFIYEDDVPVIYISITSVIEKLEDDRKKQAINKLNQCHCEKSFLDIGNYISYKVCDSDIEFECFDGNLITLKEILNK